jgi:hypothetical protein
LVWEGVDDVNNDVRCSLRVPEASVGAVAALVVKDRPAGSVSFGLDADLEHELLDDRRSL